MSAHDTLRELVAHPCAQGGFPHVALTDLRALVAEHDALAEQHTEARRLLARARLVMDHLHRDGIGPGFIATREDIAAFLGLPSESPEPEDRCAPLVAEAEHVARRLRGRDITLNAAADRLYAAVYHYREGQG